MPTHFFQDRFYQAQTITCEAGEKIQNVCKVANDVVCAQINKVTLSFVDNAERVLFAMFNVCSGSEPLLSSSKVSYLLAYILELAEQFLDFITSLAALDIEFQLELGWLDIEADEFVLMDNVRTRKEKRQVGQH